MVAVRLYRRGGVGAGDPNHPALLAGSDPNATYNPFPPKSAYNGPKVSGSKEGFILTVVCSFLGLGLIILLGWFFFKRRLQRNQIRNKLRHSSGTATRDPTALLSRKCMGKGWKEMEEEEDEEGDQMYGQEAFEMNPELNGSVLSLPFGPPSPITHNYESPLGSPEAHSSTPTTPVGGFFLNSPSNAGYDTVVKHRSPSPGAESTG